MGPVSTTQIAETGPRLVEVDPLQQPPPPPPIDPVTLRLAEPAPQPEPVPQQLVGPPDPPPSAEGRPPLGTPSAPPDAPPVAEGQPPPSTPSAPPDALPVAEGRPPPGTPSGPPEPAAAPYQGYGQGYGLPPGYPPPSYPPMAYPGFYPPPYPYPPFPPHPGYPNADPNGARPPGLAPPPDWAGQAPYPYPQMPYAAPWPPAYPAPYPTGYPPQQNLPQTPMQRTLQAQNQQLLITGIIAAVLLIHLPWLLYLYGVHGCFGSFLEVCRAVDPTLDLDTIDETPFLFARVAFFMLRVQTVLSVDFAKFSEVLQLSTGLGSFALTKIVAANGMVATGNLRRFALAGTCAVAFVVLFWAELHLTGATPYAVLGDETVLSYIDLELPADFLVVTEAKAGLMQYLQILRLADALIFGAALAMPRAAKGA